MLDFLRDAIPAAADAVFGPWTIALLLGTGLFLTVRYRFVQVTHFREGWRTATRPLGRQRAARSRPSRPS